MLRSPDYAPALRGKAGNARIMAEFGDRPISEITDRDVAKFLRNMDRDSSLSVRTVNAYRTVLSLIFDHAMAENLIGENPVAGTKRRKARPAEELIVYTSEQVWAISRECRDEQDAALVITAAFSGLRLGELCALRWRNVDLDKRVIRVTRSRSGDMPDGSTKSGQVRTVPMADGVAETLAKLGLRDDFTGPADYVFCGGNGAPISGSGASKRYVRREIERWRKTRICPRCDFMT